MLNITQDSPTTWLGSIRHVPGQIEGLVGQEEKQNREEIDEELHTCLDFRMSSTSKFGRVYLRGTLRHFVLLS